MNLLNKRIFVVLGVTLCISCGGDSSSSQDTTVATDSLDVSGGDSTLLPDTDAAQPGDTGVPDTLDPDVELDTQVPDVEMDTQVPDVEMDTLAPDTSDVPDVAAPTCMDNTKNGTETDEDCGGLTCAPCGADKACLAASDCDSAVCDAHVCEAARCGDGVINGDDECDNGDGVNSDTLVDACRTTCKPAGCGDDVMDTGEACDDGDANSDTLADACRTSCQLAACGDGVEDTDEDCDTSGQSATCDGDCSDVVCGDGTLNLAADEACDDGGLPAQDGDGCSADCALQDILADIEDTSAAHGIQGPALAIGADGLPTLVYIDAAEGALKVARCADATCADAATVGIVTVDPAVQSPGFGTTSMAIGRDGLPIIAYPAGPAVRVVKCGDAACETGNTFSTLWDDTDASADDVAPNPSLALGAGGLPVVAYREPTSEHLVVVTCGNAACSSGNTHTSLTGPGVIAPSLSLAIPDDGRPMIAVADTDNSLRLVRCDAAGCATGAQTTNALTDYPIGPPHLAVTDAGAPFVPHRGSGGLRVLSCGTPACTNPANVSIDTASSNTGSFVAAAFDVAGLPVIAHAPDVKLVRCTDAACTASTPHLVAGTGFAQVALAITPDGVPLVAWAIVNTGVLRVARVISQTPEPACDDGAHNGSETDVDCGGSNCAACQDGAGCADDADCDSGVCDDAGLCVPESCANAAIDIGEADTDCGGASCAPCAAMADCMIDDDCASGVCAGTSCAAPDCGDGVVNQPSEACDDGDGVNSDTLADACRLDCQLQSCGDGVTDAGEGCDDGGANSSTAVDGCRETCALAACGDGVMDTGEACDMGVANAGHVADACRPTCATPSCGDGVTDMGETCDAAGHSDTCDYDCSEPKCGDGVVNLGMDESCDDGNTDDGDGCSASCELEDTLEDVDPSSVITPSLGIGADGLPVIAYRNSTGVTVAKCHDAACEGAATISPIAAVAATSVGLVVRDDGLPLLAHNTSASLFITTCEDPACAHSTEVVSASEGTISPVSVALDESGRALIVYDRHTGSPSTEGVWLRRCTTAACAATDTPVRVYGSRATWPRVAVGADVGALPVLAFVDSGALIVARCSDAGCTANPVPTTTFPGSSVTGTMSLAVGPGDVPVAAYTSYNDGVHVARCESSACDSGTTDIRSAFLDAWDTSIAIGADGLPLVAVYDDAGGDPSALKVVRCADATCTTEAAEVLFIEEEVHPGSIDNPYLPSLAIGADGVPVIAYTTPVSKTLKVARLTQFAPPPSCTDSTQNGSETGVDCGGGCAACAVGEGCEIGLDCTTGVCQDRVCRVASCDNGAPDAGETDTDCGGECSVCDVGDSCAVGGDCATGACTGTVCQAPKCGDGVVNQAGEACDGGGESATCDLDCTAPACGDGVMNPTSGEHCEAGNGDGGNGCPETCRFSDSVGAVMTDNTPNYVSMALGADGYPVIAHSTDVLTVTKCLDIACDAVAHASVGDPAGESYVLTSTAVGGDGMPVVAYSEVDVGLTLAHCGDAGCTTGNTITLLTPGDAGAGVNKSLAIGANGFPVVAFVGSTGELQVISCPNATCTVAPAVPQTTVGMAENRPLALVIGDDGLPLIAYQDAGTAKTVKCHDAQCSPAAGVTTATLEMALSSGWQVSAAMGADQRPVIAYLDASDVKVARCADADCAGVVDIETVATGGIDQIALGVGPDGLPLVAAVDADAQTLTVSRCADAGCATLSDSAVIDDTLPLGMDMVVGVDGLPITAYHAFPSLEVAHFASLAPPAESLIISEYVEGSVNNKALELYSSRTTVDLSRCELRHYSNGASTPGPSGRLALSGTLAAGETLVLCHTSSNTALMSVCDVPSGILGFNGNDAIELACDGYVVDAIGRVAENPGEAWVGGDGTSTKDQTLRRACGLEFGDRRSRDAFDPSVEWTGAPSDTFDDLGNYEGCIPIIATGVGDAAVRTFADGAVAVACHAYRAPTAPYAYSGAIGDGVYRVDPDGADGDAPFEVFCDMTTDGGGWTLVDNDATDAATFTTRTMGANTDPTVTRGAYLPGYSWSADPQLRCQTSHPPTPGYGAWVTFRALGSIAMEYPTATTATGFHTGEWKTVRLNGNKDRGTKSYIYGADGRFGSVYIGSEGSPTCACSYYAGLPTTGRDTRVTADKSTCSTWVR